MPTVNLNELEDALEWVSSGMFGNEAYICRQTGKIYWSSDEIGILDDENELPDDVDNPEEYVPVPDRRDLDLGNRLAFDFTARFLADRYDEVRSIFRRRGAYGRFKALLAKHNLIERWFSFSEERTLVALEEWGNSEGFTVERSDRSTV